MDRVGIEWSCDECEARVPLAWLVQKGWWIFRRDVLVFDYTDVAAHEWSHQ